MLKAVIINDNFLIKAKERTVYESTDIKLKNSPILEAVMKTRTEDIMGGTLFVNYFPNLDETGMIVRSGLTKVVCSVEPITSDDLCAQEIFKESNIEFIINKEIML